MASQLCNYLETWNSDFYFILGVSLRPGSIPSTRSSSTQENLWPDTSIWETSQNRWDIFKTNFISLLNFPKNYFNTVLELSIQLDYFVKK